MRGGGGVRGGGGEGEGDLKLVVPRSTNLSQYNITSPPDVCGGGQDGECHDG